MTSVLLLAGAAAGIVALSKPRRDLSAMYADLAAAMTREPAASEDGQVWFGGRDIRDARRHTVTRIEVTVTRFPIAEQAIVRQRSEEPWTFEQ